MNKDIYENDLIHRFPGYTFSETPVQSQTLVEFKDGGSVTQAQAQTLVLVDAYHNIFLQMLEGHAVPAYLSTSSERDALTDVDDGTIILNIDTSEMECVNADVWQPSAGTTHIVEINTWFNMSGVSTKVYIPLAGSTSEAATGDDQRMLMPSNSGQLLGLRVYSADDLASTVFTLEEGDGGSVIGTQTVTVGSSVIVDVDFTTGLDSGVNTYDGTEPLAIGMDPTNTGNQVNVISIWEMDN